MAANHEARGSARVSLVALLLALVGSACIRHDDLKIRVYNDGPPGADLQNVHVFGGADKAWWSTVGAGTSVGSLLRPRGEPELSMTFARAGRTFNWEGPTLAAGKGYTLHIHVDLNGAVTEQHCVMPCILP